MEGACCALIAFIGTPAALLEGPEDKEKLSRELLRAPMSDHVEPRAGAGLAGKALVVGGEGGPWACIKSGGGCCIMAGGGRDDKVRPSSRSREEGPWVEGAGVAKAPNPGVGVGVACIPENKSMLLFAVGAGAAAKLAKRSGWAERTGAAIGTGAALNKSR